MEKAIFYKATIYITLAFYAVIAAIIVKFFISDWMSPIDWDYCHEFTSCADAQCCIQATTEKQQYSTLD